MSSRDQQLEALYAQLPTIDCQGHCWESCGPIIMSTAERQRIADTGVDIPHAAQLLATGAATCPALTMLHQCSVYDIRPLICRIWGATRELWCTWGCRPSRLLSRDEAHGLIRKAGAIR